MEVVHIMTVVQIVVCVLNLDSIVEVKTGHEQIVRV